MEPTGAAYHSHARLVTWLGLVLFLVVAVGGLYHVKWAPYYAKSFVAADHHAIGASILTGVRAGSASVGWRAGIAYSLQYLKAIWQALVLGLALGAGAQALLPRTGLVRFFAGRAGSLRAVSLAIPSMMCTCCAAPVAVGLLESESSAAATLVYWLANPVLNPATLIFIIFVLGWKWAALRLILGIPLVFILAHAAASVLPRGDRLRLPLPEAAPRHNFLLEWALSFWRLAVRLVPEYVVIVFALGAVRAWLFPVMTPAIGHAAWLAPVLAAVGTVFVIPTAGEVPIIQVLQHFGLGAAGAAALLMTLPTVSLPSLAMLGRVLPWRVLAVLASGTFLFGLAGAGLGLAFGF